MRGTGGMQGLKAGSYGLVLMLTAGLAAAETGDVSGDLIVFHAGSLSVPFMEVAGAFTKEYPNVRVLREAAGSRACARKIADLGRPCDVFGSADYTVIETLLIPEHAEWCVRFASNEMAIVYDDDSRRAGEINRENWHEILLDDDVAFGRSDPNADPCGYRTVLVVKLAEKHYGVEGLAEALLAKDTRHIRPKETDLLALLEANALDYIFLYRSVAEQHNLNYLTLPDEVNLKKPEFADVYRTAAVAISGKQPGETIAKRGEPMIYGVTIPNNAPNRDAAMAFVTFLLEKDKGLAVMEQSGQPSVVPSPTATYDKLPASLKEFAKPK